MSKLCFCWLKEQDHFCSHTVSTTSLRWANTHAYTNTHTVVCLWEPWPIVAHLLAEAKVVMTFPTSLPAESLFGRGWSSLYYMLLKFTASYMQGNICSCIIFSTFSSFSYLRFRKKIPRLFSCFPFVVPTFCNVYEHSYRQLLLIFRGIKYECSFSLSPNMKTAAKLLLALHHSLKRIRTVYVWCTIYAPQTVLHRMQTVELVEFNFEALVPSLPSNLHESLWTTADGNQMRLCGAGL